jgi:phosphocarrier protein
MTQTISSQAATLLPERSAIGPNTSGSEGVSSCVRQAAKLPDSTPIIRTFVLRNRYGLHCRPAVLLVKRLSGFPCTITVENGGTIVNARSILGMLSLAAGPGSKLTFIASGKEAAKALEEVQRLFDTNLAEAYPR